MIIDFNYRDEIFFYCNGVKNTLLIFSIIIFIVFYL